MRPEIKRRSKCLAVGSRSNSEVALFMAASDVLVLPSYNEGMPTVLVEAGAAGLPVIGAGVGGIPELLANGRGLVVEPRSVDSLAVALENALQNHDERKRMASRLKEYVGANYNADRQAAVLANLYRASSEHYAHSGVWTSHS